VINKLLIANRGEIVVRIARTAHAMGIATVAVYSDPDRGAPHVGACGEAVALGGATPAESYLRGEVIVAAAQRVGADAVHPGFGFLAENAAFAQAVIDAGLVWVGPPPPAIAAMGDKLEAKRLMDEAGVPVLPSVAIDGQTDVTESGEEIGLPLLVKAVAGGGGKGMRVVHAPGELEEAIAAARREAAGAFGDDRVFLERFVERPRHIEIQIVADSHGEVVHLFERECSIQRRHQKVVEETPSLALTPHLRKSMGDAAVAAARAIGYENAGTVEFVVGEADEDGERDFYFLEMNTRLQVEHPVTEAVTGIDLVRVQLRVADGAPLPFAQDEIIQRGHAIEVRLYAEDPGNDYLPATGTLASFTPAMLPGVRWDSGVRTGLEVSPHYDPMLAKVIAHAETRDEAARLLARALDETVVHGVVTNRGLLATILRDEAFLAGETTTAFLDERYPTNEDRAFPPDAETIATTAIIAALETERERSAGRRALATIPSGWRNNRGYDQRVRYETGESVVEVHYRLERDQSWTVAVDGVRHTVRRSEIGYEIEGRLHRPIVSRTEDPVRAVREVHVATAAGQVTLSEVPRFPRTGLEDVAGATLAPMPGSVVALAVGEGDEVTAGQLLVTVEAMKMEHRITAPYDGTVTEVHVAEGDQVDAGAVLVVVDEDP
jgi:propionyl-CoA carboxylase alpha chain